jgi:hypothetical protein
MVVHLVMSLGRTLGNCLCILVVMLCFWGGQTAGKVVKELWENWPDDHGILYNINVPLDYRDDDGQRNASPSILYTNVDSNSQYTSLYRKSFPPDAFSVQTPQCLHVTVLMGAAVNVLLKGPTLKSCVIDGACQARCFYMMGDFVSRTRDWGRR